MFKDCKLLVWNNSIVGRGLPACVWYPAPHMVPKAAGSYPWAPLGIYSSKTKKIKSMKGLEAMTFPGSPDSLGKSGAIGWDLKMLSHRAEPLASSCMLLAPSLQVAYVIMIHRVCTFAVPPNPYLPHTFICNAPDIHALLYCWRSQSTEVMGMYLAHEGLNLRPHACKGGNFRPGNVFQAPAFIFLFMKTLNMGPVR